MTPGAAGSGTAHALADAFFTRIWWTADLERAADAVWLLPRPGARHVAIWRNSLELFDERVVPADRLQARAGDRFVACGPTTDETVGALVLEVDGDRLRVALVGELEVETAVVHLLGVTPRVAVPGGGRRAARKRGLRGPRRGR